ncbi:hypothetical protein Tco_0545141 [Tanacetum coccineum]
MVTLVDGVLANGVVMIFEMDIAFYVIQGTDEFFQDFLNTSESSNDNTNVVNAPQEPFVFNQDPGENSSQSPPHIDHHCCYGCGDSLAASFVTIVLMSLWERLLIMAIIETISEIEHAFEDNQYQLEGILELFRKLHDGVQNIHEELAECINTPNWNRPIVYYNDDDDDDEDYTIVISPVLSTKEPVDSLIMEDEHLDTILATELNEVIKFSVEDLVPIPSESEGIPDNMCDVPFRDNSLPLDISKDQFEGFSDSIDDSTSIDDDSFSIDDIDYVEASPPDSELVSLEVVEIVIPEVRGIDTDILLTIKDDILRETLLNVNLLIVKIEALKDYPTASSNFMTKSSSTSLNFFLEETNTFDNSLPESKTFCFNLEEISSGSPTSYLDLSLPDYEAFFCDSEPDSGNFTMDVVEDISDNPTKELYVHVLHDLPTHPTFYLDSDFTLSSDSPGSDLVVSFPSEIRNKIFDPGIFIEVQSEKFLSRDEFSISFIRDPLSPVIDTLLPFLSKNEDKVVNSSILAADEDKSPYPSSHWGLRVLNESPMMISREDIPILDVPFLHFYPP